MLDAFERDLSPAEQQEAARRARLSPKLERLEVEDFTQAQMQAMLALSGLGDLSREQALLSLEKSLKGRKKKKGH